MTLEEEINLILEKELRGIQDINLFDWDPFGEPFSSPFRGSFNEHIAMWHQIDLLIWNAPNEVALTSPSQYVRKCKEWLNSNG